MSLTTEYHRGEWWLKEAGIVSWRDLPITLIGPGRSFLNECKRLVALATASRSEWEPDRKDGDQLNIACPSGLPERPFP
jgi:hypothetical protein